MVLTVVGAWSVGPGHLNQGPQVHPPGQVFGGSAGRSAASETGVDSKIHVPRRKTYDMSSLLNPFLASPALRGPAHPANDEILHEMSEHTCTAALTACGRSHAASRSAFPIVLFNMSGNVPAAPQVEEYS